jgi:hypothetical protein
MSKKGYQAGSAALVMRHHFSYNQESLRRIADFSAKCYKLHAGCAGRGTCDFDIATTSQ